LPRYCCPVPGKAAEASIASLADLIDLSDCSSCSKTEIVSVVISTTVTCPFTGKESIKGIKRNTLENFKITPPEIKT
jgi:hypothetical protein